MFLISICRESHDTVNVVNTFVDVVVIVVANAVVDVVVNVIMNVFDINML
jgi:hypothetical protein